MNSAKGVSVGDKFRVKRGNSRTGRTDICTVVDIYTTTNIAGEVVKTEFKAVHDFMGQQLSEMVVAPTVLRNKI